MITWPQLHRGYTLQYRPSLGTQNWAPLGTPPTVSGTNWLVIETTSTGSRFYRLRK
jgi:hypothetical protein